MISLIVAMGKNRVIGKDNQMPWHLPADLAYFKKVTTGHPIIMGRKTFQSIGRPLPNRENIILTRDKMFKHDNCTIINCVEEALALAASKDIFVIGGAEIYEQFLPFAKKIYITQIHENFSGDTFFPKLTKEWQLQSSQLHSKDEKNKYDYEFQLFEKLV